MEILFLLVGVLLGVAIAMLISRTKFVGTLRIDRSDSDQPYMFLELDKIMSNVISKKHVVLKVKLENYIPHK